MKALLCGVLLLATAIPAAAANFSGKWAVQSAPGRGGARREAPVIALIQVGDVVTGTMTMRIDPGTHSPVNEEIWGGKVEGDTISFYVWLGADRPAKTTYTGKLSSSGEEIVFSVTGVPPPVGGIPGGGPAVTQQVTAKRTK